MSKTIDAEGSKLRCQMLTEPPSAVPGLNALIRGYGEVDTSHCWMPRGRCDRKEPTLSKRNGLLPPDQCDVLRRWWLACGNRRPSWDIASKCRVGNAPGLLLVEAKAHWDEVKEKDSLKSTNSANQKKIGAAVEEANEALNKIVPGFHLGTQHHYQLSNRFAWAWKIASLGTPVILAYLGFLNAHEMSAGNRKCRLFETECDWQKALTNYADGVIPEDAWEHELKTAQGASLYPTMHTLNLNP